MKKLILHNIFRFKGSIISVLICIVTIGAIRQTFPLLFGYLIQNISYELNRKVVLGIILTYSCLFLCAQILHFIENLTYADLFNNMLLQLREKCFIKFCNAKKEKITEFSKGKLLTIINEDVNQVLDFINNCLINLISVSIELIIVLVFSFYINWIVATYIVLCITLSIVVSKNIGKIVQKLHDEQRKNKSEVVSFVVDVLEGRQEIVLMNAFDSINHLYCKIKNKQLKNEYIICTKNVLIERTNSLISLLSNIGLMVISCLLVCKGDITMGNYVTYTIYFETALAMMNFYGYLAQAVPECKASINRVVNLLNIEQERNGEEVIDKIEEIAIKDFSFSYGDENNQIKLDSLFVKKGEVLLIKGKSGAGKTTIIKNLLGLFEEYGGEILINGNELSRIDKKSLRNKAAVLLQGDDFYIGETIYDNICMNQSICKSDVLTLVRDLNMEGYIMGLSKDMDTNYNAEKLGISGGQKQRLLLVRTLLKNSELIVLDEPTASLDKENEDRFYNIIKQFKKKRIIIVISHRESTKCIADKMIDLDIRGGE